MTLFPYLEEAAKAVDDLETAISKARTDIRRALLAQLRDLQGDDWQALEVVSQLRKLQVKLRQQEKRLKDFDHSVENYREALKQVSETRDLLLH